MIIETGMEQLEQTTCPPPIALFFHLIPLSRTDQQSEVILLSNLLITIPSFLGPAKWRGLAGWSQSQPGGYENWFNNERWVQLGPMCAFFYQQNTSPLHFGTQTPWNPAARRSPEPTVRWRTRHSRTGPRGSAAMAASIDPMIARLWWVRFGVTFRGWLFRIRIIRRGIRSKWYKPTSIKRWMSSDVLGPPPPTFTLGGGAAIVGLVAKTQKFEDAFLPFGCCGSSSEKSAPPLLNPQPIMHL